MKRIGLSTLFALLFFLSAQSQKKIMDEQVYSDWNRITSTSISNNGEWIKYHLSPGKGDKTLMLYNSSNGKTTTISRVKQSGFSEDNRFLIYSVAPSLDTIQMMKRKKVDKKKMPKDTLYILDLRDNSRDTVPMLINYKLPEKWSGLLAYKAKIDVNSKLDSLADPKWEERFFIRNLLNGSEDTLKTVSSYLMATESPTIAFLRTGKDSADLAGVFSYEMGNVETIISSPGSYENLAIDGKGRYVSFINDLDTTDRRIRPYNINLWDGQKKTLEVLAGGLKEVDGSSQFISKNTRPTFSDDGKLLYFGISDAPVLGDSLALEEDEVQVEVWTTEDPMLYTMQENRSAELTNKTYEMMYQIELGQSILLEDASRDDLIKSNKGNGPYYLTTNVKPYEKETTWLGNPSKDVFMYKSNTDEHWEVARDIRARFSFSPGGQYLSWFDSEKGAWFLYNIEKKESVNVSDGLGVQFTNELHDSPSDPRPYGSAGWSTEDEFFYIYDRYDIWKIPAKNRKKTVRLTDGRKSKQTHRIIRLDREKDELEEKSMVHLFNENDKSSGYGKLDLNTGKLELLESGAFSYTRRPTKAKDADVMTFTKESFETFPDLILTNTSLKNQKQISQANPQQEDYNWGTIELFKWKDYDGQEVEGLLVKPEDFDPMKKYPVIVNFYERSTSGLHRHRAPEPHRSTINYSYYTNKGYIIFNPNVRYDIGYPGESCYKAVISGVEALSKNQFVDKERIGVQGHSWGGYQIAYLLNKTNLFKCAESGAPVVNMISAYGGIRWGSGMSRMFQYEKTQSRLGATLWENPELYIQNSPIFEVDKMNTPVLILHNDMDGAVPWYQGIEYYMALRRLNKKAWFLNYNNEPHWPLKWENRIDFNRRMEQFFAYYLKDEALPKWMKSGVPVTEKGIRQGFEYVDEK